MIENIHKVAVREHEYVGFIVPSAKYDPPDSIRMTTLIADFPFRVIMKKDISAMDDVPYSYTKPVETIRYVQGSGNNVYTVKTVDGVTTCTCPGFNFRHTCRHING